nr:hypothetical protein [uncultured Oscillibacter sp.]
MRDWIRTVLERYGQAVTVRRADGETSARAFLQPVTERTEQAAEAFPGIGWLDGRLWLYLGQTEVGTDDLVLWNGMEFRVRSGRPYRVGDETLYWWASLERAKEAAE